MDVFNKFIQTPFVAGYTYGFCRMGFSNMGYGTQSEKMYDRWLSYITSPVILNGKFTEVIKIQVNALEQAKALGDDTPVHMFTKGRFCWCF